MKTLKLILITLAAGLFFIFGCEKEVTNPFDANCPKELFTPTDFKAAQQSNSIILSWKQENTQISGFVISRNENDGPLTEVTRIDKTVTSWNDPNVKGGIKYGYRLAAYAGENQSNTVTAFYTPVYGATVSTDAVSGITSTTVVLGGNVTDEGGAPVTERGVCYGTTLNPTTADKKAEMGKGPGSFSLAIPGLTAGNTYFARAYAINSQGTTYGTQVTFTTSFLTISPTSFNVPKESASKEFTVASNIEWQVSSNQTWCTLSATSGKGNGSVAATFAENKEVPQRTATIIFTGTGVASQTATLTQSGTEPPVLTITPENQNVTNTAGTTTFTITGNVSWTATSDQSWCTITNTRGVGNGTLTINYEANTTNSQRIANLAIIGFGLSEKTVTITQQSVLPTEGLVAYYPFNGNANDESGNGNNGIVHGASLISGRTGNTNGAYYFNGSTYYIEVPNSSSISFANSIFSIAIWIKTTLINYDTSRYPVVIGKNSPYPDRHGYDMTMAQNNGLIYYEIHADGSAGRISTGIDINDNKWHLLVGIRNGASLSFYVDNKLVGNNTFTGSSYNTYNLYIGGLALFSYSNFYFEGIIDDVRLFNRTLNEIEIQQLYNE